MKVVLVNGSPHEKGCTYTALSEIEKVLNKNGVETYIFQLGSSVICGCIGCGSCRKNKKCVFDDKVNEFAKLINETDGFIFGSPVHFAAASGNLTSFMDRLFYAYMYDFAGKPAACVLSCRRGGATAAFDQINKYFTITNMPVVSSQYWNMVHGNSPEEVVKDLEGLQIMRTLGNNMAWLLKCINAGKKQGIDFPEREQSIKTNFIR